MEGLVVGGKVFNGRGLDPYSSWRKSILRKRSRPLQPLEEKYSKRSGPYSSWRASIERKRSRLLPLLEGKYSKEEV